MQMPFACVLGTCCLIAMVACATPGVATDSADVGPQPTLPAPQHRLLPTLNIAPALGWPEGAAPQAGPGLQVAALARNLIHPRWLYVLPNGDVLVAETNAPTRPGDGKGIRGWIMGRFMSRAGARGQSAERITLLRDSDGDGIVDLRSVLVSGLHSPFGMALIGNVLYVANTDAILKFPYHTGDTQLSGPGTTLVALPAGAINHHWTKNLLASADGSRLYVTIGSNSNIGENGITAETDRASIWEVDIQSGTHRTLASGLRNPNGLAWEPAHAALWTVVNERDELGNSLVPDYLTAVQDGGFYGWPYSYFGRHVDTRMQPPRPDLVARALTPDYALGAHTASLGLAWSGSNRLPAPYAEGMFIGQHGSWNRRPHSGYQVIFVPFRDGQPAGLPVVVLGGFLSTRHQAFGRPVGVALDKHGALLVADDVGNTIWRVTAKPTQE